MVNRGSELMRIDKELADNLRKFADRNKMTLIEATREYNKKVKKLIGRKETREIIF